MPTAMNTYRTVGALVDAFQVEVYRYLLRLTGSAAEADDLFQETFLRALRAFDRLRPRSNHRAWLYRIATNVFLNAHRAARRRREVSLPTELSANAKTTTRLPPRQRAAFVQRALEGRAYAQIAAALGVARRRPAPTSIRPRGGSGAC